jgi:hypothetical protein
METEGWRELCHHAPIFGARSEVREPTIDNTLQVHEEIRVLGRVPGSLAGQDVLDGLAGNVLDLSAAWHSAVPHPSPGASPNPTEGIVKQPLNGVIPRMLFEQRSDMGRHWWHWTLPVEGSYYIYTPEISQNWSSTTQKSADVSHAINAGPIPPQPEIGVSAVMKRKTSIRSQGGFLLRCQTS